MMTDLRSPLAMIMISRADDIMIYAATGYHWLCAQYQPDRTRTLLVGEYLTAGAPLRVLVSTLPGSWSNKDPRQRHRRGTSSLAACQCQCHGERFVLRQSRSLPSSLGFLPGQQLALAPPCLLVLRAEGDLFWCAASFKFKLKTVRRRLCSPTRSH